MADDPTPREVLVEMVGDAPAGAVWVCAACGKRAKNRSNGGIDRMWDESCFLHAVLCDEASIVMTDGRVSAATPLGGEP